MYSNDLGNIINLLLQVTPSNRPTCDQILNNDIIKKRMNLLNKNQDID